MKDASAVLAPVALESSAGVPLRARAAVHRHQPIEAAARPSEACPPARSCRVIERMLAISPRTWRR